MSRIGSGDTARGPALGSGATADAAELVPRRVAQGVLWVFRGNGRASGSRLAELGCRHLGRDIETCAAGARLLVLFGRVWDDLRAWLPMVPHRVHGASFDFGELCSLLPVGRTTSGEVPAGFGTQWPLTRDSEGC